MRKNRINCPRSINHDKSNQHPASQSLPPFSLIQQQNSSKDTVSSAPDLPASATNSLHQKLTGQNRPKESFQLGFSKTPHRLGCLCSLLDLGSPLILPKKRTELYPTKKEIQMPLLLVLQHQAALPRFPAPSPLPAPVPGTPPGPARRCRRGPRARGGCRPPGRGPADDREREVFICVHAQMERIKDRRVWKVEEQVSEYLFFLLEQSWKWKTS